MYISFERSGGFTGIPIVVTIDSSTLSPDQVVKLRQLVQAANFFNLPEMIPAAPQPDRFQYTITIRQNTQNHTVIMAEQAVPDPCRPLLNWLMEAARQR